MIKFEYEPIQAEGKDEVALVHCTTDMVQVILPQRYHFVPVTRVAQKAFSRLSTVVEVIIPASIQTIDAHAFAYCGSLRRVRFATPASPKLGLGVFQGCAALQQVELPEGIEEVGDAFYDCTALREINIPDSVRRIDLGGCTALRQVRLPLSLELSDHDILARCSEELSVVSPDELGGRLASSLAMWDLRQLSRQLVGFAALLEHGAFFPEQLEQFLPETCRKVVAKLLPTGRELQQTETPRTQSVLLSVARARSFLQPEEEACVRFLLCAVKTGCALPEEVRAGIQHLLASGSVTYEVPEEGEEAVEARYDTCFGLHAEL